MAPAVPRLVVGGVASGVGKTSAVVGLCRALRARGLRVAVFKCGPDYLDPTYHARASGAICHNLDGWLMGQQAVQDTFARATAGCDIALIEGVMGLFDGASPSSHDGSTAQIAAWLNAPVLLVVDAGGMARSFAAVVEGFARFDAGVHVAGVITNRVGSRSHLDLLQAALTDRSRQQSDPARRLPPILGGFPSRGQPRFPERHLGLHTASHAAVPDADLDAWGTAVEAWWNVDGVLALARSAAATPAPASTSIDPPLDRAAAPASPSVASPACRIGIAQDEAFHFYYEDNLHRLRALGATLVPFSPLRDQRLPADLAGLYLGGGYPEVHAAALTNNHELRVDIARLARAGRPIYGECGGLMYLCDAIVTPDGTRHPMLGLLPGTAVMTDGLVALGYVEVELQTQTPLGAPGLRFRGHQFRHSRLDGDATAAGAYRVRKRRGGETFLEGHQRANVLGSYVHAHWASNPLIAAAFVQSCRA